ncbi:MAG: BrnT family toxin [Vicinamibacterales bacterium]|nr:BrnT family toxin [Vicinamibacterales bacterium]
MGELDDLVAGLEGFEWDDGNSAKNWLRHEVQQAEAEQALLNTPLVVAVTLKHGAGEPRYVALGQTDTGRLLTVVFTVRGTKVRVISARAMSKPERKVYGEVQANSEGRPGVQD